MLYVTRGRYKESVTASELPSINRHFDTEVIPALRKVAGTRSVEAYNSINGEIAFFLDIEDMATVDRILRDPGCRAVLDAMLDYLVRTGGEVFFDRPAWQGLYGSGQSD